MVSADDLRLTEGSTSTSILADAGGTGGGRFSASGAGGRGAAFPLPFTDFTEGAILARDERTEAEVALDSVDTFRGVTFFAALEAVDMAERIEAVERVE
jgi:hypothetical protein